MIERRARKLREIISGAVQSVDDATALEGMRLFPAWADGVHYVVGERVYYDEALYRVLQEHDSTPEWTPDVAVSLFAKVLIPDPGDIPEWEQPTSTNAYMTGDKVRHNGLIWISDIDNNVWEPGVYGWTEVDG